MDYKRLDNSRTPIMMAPGSELTTAPPPCAPVNLSPEEEHLMSTAGVFTNTYGEVLFVKPNVRKGQEDKDIEKVGGSNILNRFHSLHINSFPFHSCQFNSIQYI
jgi:hypothetical protein